MEVLYGPKATNELCRYAQAAALLGNMEPQYGVAPDEFSFAALCVAVQQSDLSGSEAVAEAGRIEAAITTSGKHSVKELCSGFTWHLVACKAAATACAFNLQQGPNDQQRPVGNRSKCDDAGVDVSTELGTTMINAYCKGGAGGMKHAERVLQSMLVRLFERRISMLSHDVWHVLSIGHLMQSARLAGAHCGECRRPSECGNIQLNARSTQADGSGQLRRISSTPAGSRLVSKPVVPTLMLIYA